jgi:XTP/dITP diphosphohydrolase
MLLNFERTVMNELVFATNNAHKLEEVIKICPSDIKIISLNELGVIDDIPETGLTLSENASQKAWFIYERFAKNCFADDTGLEIDALNGAPGVFSARYAGEMRDSKKNMNLVLEQMENHKERSARFKTTISLILNGIEYQFEGVVDGTIAHKPIGEKGFGYDPIFVPDGYDQTFAQLEMDVKNRISHRGRAVAKLVEFLTTNVQVESSKKR